MKKRYSLLMLAVFLAGALTIPARADLIWEPENRFYQTHNCTAIERTYYANGPEGFVTLWDAPDGSRVEGQYENGTRLRVYWGYKDWGCITRWEDGAEVSGWVPMDHLAELYDWHAFEAEYGDRFRPYNGEFAGYDGAPEIVFWAYPGAPEPNVVVDTDSRFARDLGSDDTFWGSTWQNVFTDENGLTWGFIRYHETGWLCFDDPTATEFPVREVEEAELIPAQTPVMPEPAAAYVPYVLVGAVVVVTAGLLFWFYFRKRGKG